MRKLFTLAAVCCMLLVTLQVKAAFSNGVVIKISGTELNDADAADVFGDTKGSYDQATNTLTLNSWVNVSDYKKLFIDCKSMTSPMDFTIKVIGKCQTDVSASAYEENPPIRFIGATGKGLIIEGDENAELRISAGGSGYFNCAITCRSSYTDSKYYPVTIKGGMTLIAQNKYTKSSTYPVIECDRLSINNSEVRLETGNPYQTTGALYCNSGEAVALEGDIAVFPASRLQDKYEVRKVGEKYPVWINGYQLNSLTSELVNSDMEAVVYGHIKYDATNRTLYLDNYFQLDARNTAAGAAIVIDDQVNTTDPVIIKSDAALKKITAYGANNNGLLIKSPAKMDLSGTTMNIKSNFASGILLQNKLEVSSSFGTGQLNAEGASGIKGDGAAAEFAPSSIEVQATGSEAGHSFYGFKYTPDNERWKSGQDWSETKQSAVDGSDNAIGSSTVAEIYQEEYIIMAISEPAGVGSFTATLDGSAITLPYKYNEDDVTLTIKAASANPKYEFYKWLDEDVTDAERTKDIYSAQNCYWQAKYRRLVDTNLKYFLIEGHTVKFWAANSKFKGMLSDLDNLNISYDINSATYAEVSDEGRLYFVAWDGGTYYGIQYVTFDGADLGTIVKDLVAPSSAYENIIDIAYSETDAAIYAVAQTSIGWGLYKFPVDGSPYTAFDFSENPNMLAFAIDNSNTMYGINADNDLYKYSISGSNVVMTKIGTLADLTLEASEPTKTAMTFDPVTNELIAQVYTSSMDDRQTILIDPTTAKWEMINERDLAAAALFAIPPVLPKYKITIKSNDVALGTVDPACVDKLYKQGAKINVTATPTEYGVFKSWSDGGAQNHQIDVTGDMTYVATFEADPENTPYPIWINGKRLTSKNSVSIVGPNSDFGLDAGGVIAYDNESKTLTLTNATITASGTAPAAIQIEGAAGSKTSALQIAINGTCKLKGPAGVQLSYADNVTFIDGKSGDLTITATTTAGIKLEDAELTFYGLIATIAGATHGIQGNASNCKLNVTGSTLTLNAVSTGTVMGIKNQTLKYCKITDPATTGWKDGNLVDGSENVIKAKVVYTRDKMLTVDCVEAKSGTFTMKADGTENFKDGKGWFENGKEVTISAKAANGYVFGRWLDDDNWNDPDNRIPATRTYTMGSSDKTLTALFYYKPKSTAKWYGVNKTQFSTFKMSDQCLTVARATAPSGTGVKTGEYVSGNWFYLDGTTVYGVPFSGNITDGEDIKGTPVDKATTTLTNITDMAYNFKNGRAYVVAGKELYYVNVSESKLDLVGELQYKGSAIAVVCLAIDENGKFYVLTPSLSSGQLFTFELKDVKDEKVAMTACGDEAAPVPGSIQMPVSSEAHSMAFDHLTGELFWGCADYMRLNNPTDCSTRIVGDIGNSRGNQGLVKGLHRMDKKVTVSVEVPERQNKWGIAYIGSTSEQYKSVIAGSKVTITAKANEGYHFDYWTVGEGTEPAATEASYTLTASSSVTYVAHFAAGEGITEISIDPTQDVQKVLIDGQIYIVRDGRIYTITGAMVK